jgi:hypothetical protein
MAMMSESTETAVVVMSMAEKVADVTDRKAVANVTDRRERQTLLTERWRQTAYWRELWCVSSVSDVRIMWNITSSAFECNPWRWYRGEEMEYI